MEQQTLEQQSLTPKARPPAAAASIVPQLSVRHGRAAVEFYKTAFGAVEEYRVGGTDDNEAVVAQLSVGGARFWVADESPDHANYSPDTVGGSTTRILLIVDDPESVVGRAVAAGATEVWPVQEEYGWLLGRVADPFGHHWEIGKPLTVWPPAGGGHDPLPEVPDAVGDQPGDSDEPRIFRPGGVSYLHIPAPDPQSSAAFYRAVFAWKIRDDDHSPAFEDGTGHVIGHFLPELPVAGEAGVLPYVYVESVDETLDRVTSNGGVIVRPPFPEGDLLVATFHDPAGNLLGVWQRR